MSLKAMNFSAILKPRATMSSLFSMLVIVACNFSSCMFEVGFDGSVADLSIALDMTVRVPLK